MTSQDAQSNSFNILNASISEHRAALESGEITSVELAISCLIRIAKYDIEGGVKLPGGPITQPLNAFTLINPRVLEEALESDLRRASSSSIAPLDGVPYTLKDSYSYRGLTVTNGSPALAGLQSRDDSAIAARLRAAGAVMLGKTNMPPMAAGGMQRGLYGRAESPYHPDYLTAAFSSGSSNGAATSTAASMAVFGMASETVSSGRSAASNNALVCYTPSRGILSCRGLWPLYVTCDTPVPYARSMADLLEVLAVIAGHDSETRGDFWREQKHVALPSPPLVDYRNLSSGDLKGKRIGVPKMYVGQQDDDPNAKHPVVHRDVVALWERAKADLEALGAEVLYTNFPIITNYENDSVSNEANNVVGAPADWNRVERSSLIAKAWDEFLVQNQDSKLNRLVDVNAELLFPKPEGYLPDKFLEVRNWIDYEGLPAIAHKLQDMPLLEHQGLAQALASLEAQRKRDLEDWMDQHSLDCIAFPSAGDVGLADLEFNLASATHSLQNGIKYSNGNRAIRHLGVPTVSIPMGVMSSRQMPVNLTFAGKAYDDEQLLKVAQAYEQATARRTSPPLAPLLESDIIARRARDVNTASVRALEFEASLNIKVDGDALDLELSLSFLNEAAVGCAVEVWVNGNSVTSKKNEGNVPWTLSHKYVFGGASCLGWDLQPLPRKPVMVLVVARAEAAHTFARLLWAN